MHQLTQRSPQKHADKFAFDITIPGANGVLVRHLHCENEIERIHWLLNLEEALGGLNVGASKGRDGGENEEGYIPMEWSEGEDDEDDEDEVEQEQEGEEETKKETAEMQVRL